MSLTSYRTAPVALRVQMTKTSSTDGNVRATGTVVEVCGKYFSVGNPIKMSDSPSEVIRSPLLGEHTDEILR
jgi:formyl-CoA transferase